MLLYRFITVVACACLTCGVWAQGITPSEAYRKDFSGSLQQQLQNDPALSPQKKLPELGLPAAKAQPQPQPEDEQAAKITVREFVITGNTLASSQDIQSILSGWLNIPISLMELNRGVAQIAELYRSKGYLAQGVLPEQDVTEGTVRVQVVEGKVGKIRIDAPQDQPQLGAFVLDRVQTLLAHKMPEGQALNFDDYDWAMLVADDLPGVSVEAALQAGVEPGTTDIVVQVKTTAKVRGVVSTDNNGSRNTGPLRVNAQLQLDSALGWGEQFSLSSSKNQGSTYVRLDHSIPFGAQGWKGLTLNANVSQMNYKVLDAFKPDGANFAPQGTSNTFGVSMRYPFVRSARTTLVGEFGYDHRHSVDKGDSLTAQSSTPELGVTRDTQVGAVNLSFTLSHTDDLGGGGANTLQATYSDGRMDLGPSGVRSEDVIGTNTSGPFRKIRFTASRMQLIDAQHSALISLTGQQANRNLDSSEKLYLGGSSTIRAYPNSELGGSVGYVATVELRRDWNESWQTSYFYDHGKVWQYKTPYRADDPSTPLLTDIANAQVMNGQGFTLTYRQPGGMELKATVSRRTSPNPVPTQSGTDKDGTLRMNRWWFSASYPF